jgi:sugar phosphate isomerase/epimerase
MNRLSVNEVTTFRWTFEEDVNRYRAAGFSAMGVWRRKLAEFGEDEGLDLLRDQRMAVSSLMWAGGFTGMDGRTHAESIDDGLDAVRLAAAMGAACLLVYTGGRGGHTHKHARKLATEGIRELAGLADDLEVVLAIEPYHPRCSRDWSFLQSLADALEFVQELATQHANAKIVFDTYHLSDIDMSCAEWQKLIPRIGLVQLADARAAPHAEQNRCPLGMGALPVAESVHKLLQGGYQGFFEVELIGEEIEDSDYEELLRQTRQTFAMWSQDHTPAS